MARHIRLVALAAACVLLAGACGTSSNTASSGASGSSGGSGSGGTLVIGMTATNIPGLDTGMFQSEGGEGGRFVGVQLYDGLTRFDLTQGDHAPDIKPGLATSWDVTPDATNWTFHLRTGVKFTDGTPWNADAAIFNLDRMTNKSSPDYYPELNATAGLFLGGIASSKKIDDMTIQITTKGPYSYLLGDLALLPFGSPTAIKAEGKDGFAQHPVGTGPFKVESYVRGQKLVMVRNPDWRGAPKLDRVILRPIPDATARQAALQSGEVNWIEVPPPDSVPALKSAGFNVLTNSYSHVWPWVLDITKKPFDDVRVRQAVNYAIDRDTLSKSILNGTGRPALQYAPVGEAGYDKSLDTYSYDPAKAKQLLAAAGYPNGFSFSLSFPTSGSGNMVPIPMNEELQKGLAAVGVQVKLQPVEWGSMLTDFFAGKIPGITAALVPLGIVARMFRSSLLEVLGQDYIEALRARGIPSWRLYLHAFHNTLPSLLTVAGLQLGYLLGGVIFVEAVFSWPGIGLLVFQSISQRDLPLIQAGVLVSALVFVVLNLAVDALHGIVDPRIRHSH